MTIRSSPLGLRENGDPEGLSELRSVKGQPWSFSYFCGPWEAAQEVLREVRDEPIALSAKCRCRDRPDRNNKQRGRKNSSFPLPSNLALISFICKTYLKASWK